MPRRAIAEKVADDARSASFIREMFEKGRRMISEHGAGIDLFLDIDAIDDAAAARAHAVLQEAVAALEARTAAADKPAVAPTQEPKLA